MDDRSHCRFRRPFGDPSIHDLSLETRKKRNAG